MKTLNPIKKCFDSIIGIAISFCRKLGVTTRRNSRGTSLLELTVTTAIIGTISSIGVSSYNKYIQESFDMQTIMDIKNLALAEENAYIDNNEYISCVNTECLSLSGMSKISPSSVVTVAALGDGYKITGYNEKGTGKVITWDSKKGGFTNSLGE